MSPRTLVTFAVAILLGLIAVLLVRHYITPQTGPGGQAAAGGGLQVVVAAQPIKRGDKVSAGLLKVVRLPLDAAPTGAFNAVAPLVGASGAERVALREIAQNEPVLPTNVSEPGGRAVLSATVAQGMRAVSLRSNEVAGVAGFVLPGDRVDVLLTRDAGKNDGTVLTQLLADNVLVLGVDQTDDDQTKKPQVAKAVTVQVTPDQAQVIALAHQLGSLSLALRGASDDGAPMRKSTTVADLAVYGVRPSGVARAVVRARTAPSRLAAQKATQTVHVTRGVVVAGYDIAGR